MDSWLVGKDDGWLVVGELVRMMFRLATWMQITGSGVVLKT